MRYWREIVVGFFLLLITCWVLWWILSPLVFKKDIEKATENITAVATNTVEDKREVSKETNANAAKSIRRTQERTVVAASAVSNSPDGDAAFFEFVCNNRLYKADPRCLSRGGEGR